MFTVSKAADRLERNHAEEGHVKLALVCEGGKGMKPFSPRIFELQMNQKRRIHGDE
jgi:hypothetical protein